MVGVAASKAENPREWWHRKHPVRPIVYDGRPLPAATRPFAWLRRRRQYSMDIRHFVWAADVTLEELIDGQRLRMATSLDAMAGQVQEWVARHITYRTDRRWGVPEFWLLPAETLALGSGDCEDGAILITSMLRTALPDSERWRARVAAGLVRAHDPHDRNGVAGHAWATYCRTLDDDWVILDWCYESDAGVPVKHKVRAREASQYVQTWFSWNDEYAYSHEAQHPTGRMRRWVRG